MKKVVLTSILALFVFAAQAQFDKGDKQANVGIGLFGLGVNVGAQYGIIDDLGVGVYATFERNTYGLGLVGLGNYSINRFLVGPYATYHFNRLFNISSDKFDVYATGGFLVGGGRYSSEWANYYTTSGATFTDYDFIGRVGGKYKMSDKMSLFGDVGSGGSLLQGGISFKF
jgi:hypothetical protein